MIHLLAEIEVWIYEKDISIRGNSQYSTQSAKRLRRYRQGNIVDDTLVHVCLLGPVTCIFIQNHGALLAEEDFEMFCSRIGKQIQDSLQHSFVAEQVKPGMLYMPVYLSYKKIKVCSFERRCHLVHAIAAFFDRISMQTQSFE